MDYTWIRATNSQVICTAPGFVGCIIVTPDSDNDTAYASLHDGESVKDPKICRIRCKAGVTSIMRFQPPLKTNRGLYIDFEDHVEEVLIQHSWGPE